MEERPGGTNTLVLQRLQREGARYITKTFKDENKKLREELGSIKSQLSDINDKFDTRIDSDDGDQNKHFCRRHRKHNCRQSGICVSGKLNDEPSSSAKVSQVPSDQLKQAVKEESDELKKE